jgi:hypothetical protein
MTKVSIKLMVFPFPATYTFPQLTLFFSNPQRSVNMGFHHNLLHSGAEKDNHAAAGIGLRNIKTWKSKIDS